MLPYLAQAAAAVADESARPIHLLSKDRFEAWLAAQSDRWRAWIAANDFKPDAGRSLLLPGADGGVAAVLVGLDRADLPWPLAGLPRSLPAGRWKLAEGALDSFPDRREAATQLALGWALGGHVDERFLSKTEARPLAVLVLPAEADGPEVERLAEATILARELINAPTEALGPAQLAGAVRRLGESFGASVTVTSGEALLAANLPVIHLVGRAAAAGREPCLADLVWGNPVRPKVTLVGKGVCFDSGGLDLKPASGMRLMKKDMGGAATLIGLAQAVMAAGLPIRLRLLVPAVENAVSANAFRPGDVVKARSGKTVEIHNTDAEGRLILGDALALAAEEKPDLIIDVATLTGAARTALGPQLPALFANAAADGDAGALLAAARRVNDPLWRLPLWKPYRDYLDSKLADIANASDSGFAGAITAALYLAEFVPDGCRWLHLDSYAWSEKARPGRPVGGDALALRALYSFLVEGFAR